MQGLSLFASAGIAEMNLGKYINFVLANELLPIRSKVHRFWHPKAEMICGDITDDKIKENIIEKSVLEVNDLFITPNEVFVPNLKLKIEFKTKSLSFRLVEAVFDKTMFVNDHFEEKAFGFDEYVVETEELNGEKKKPADGSCFYG